MSDKHRDEAIEHALFRVGMMAATLEKGRLAPAGSDVSLFRALRELRRALNVSPIADEYDPSRVLRTALTEGVEDVL